MSSSSDNDNDWKGYAIIFVAVIMWSFSEILQKLLQDTVPPMQKSFFRFLIGTLTLLVVVIVKKDWEFKEIFKQNKFAFLFGGFITYGLGNYVYFVGIINTNANIGSAIYGSYPIFISIYSFFILGEKENIKRRLIGYILGLGAIFVLVTEFNFENLLASENLFGNIMVLLGSLIWSSYSVLGKQIKNKYKKIEEEGGIPIQNIDLKWNILTMVFAGIFNLVFVFIIPEERATFFNYPPSSWLYLILLGVFCTGIGTCLFFVGVSKIELSKGISLAMLKAIFVIILAYFILGETPSILLLVCVPCIIFAVYLITKK
jgi:drug/metabolite transporter (DMT)-like permease